MNLNMTNHYKEVTACQDENQEPLIETYAVQVGETAWGEAIAEPREELVGTYCHKREEYNVSCWTCERWKEDGNEI